MCRGVLILIFCLSFFGCGQPSQDIFFQVEEKEVIDNASDDRFSKQEQKKIYEEISIVQEKARLEAEKRYPTNMNSIPKSQWRTYDFKEAIEKNADLEEELRLRYEAEILERYQLSQEERNKIVYAGVLEKLK